MTPTVENILEKMGYVLPDLTPAIANYIPWRLSGSLVYVSGQLPMQAGKPHYVGKVGQEFSLEEGQKAAELCAINILAQLKQAVDGDWSRVVACVRLGGFVNATADFTAHPQVINGASNLIVDALGERGKHARAAVGVGSLPLGVAVEVEALFEIR
ncbi:MAG: RidA family protein [Holosporales bacterium]